MVLFLHIIYYVLHHQSINLYLVGCWVVVFKRGFQCNCPALRFSEFSIHGLSRIVYSSIRAVRNAYLRFARSFWSPSVDVSENGVLDIEGFKLHFYQSEPDVRGGCGVDDAGNKYCLRGGNQLEKITIVPILDVFGRKIAVLVMEFRGEEHPNPVLDKIWRGIRACFFFRLRDVEAIALEFTRDKLRIAFRRICSGNKTFASKIGVHKTRIVETEKTHNNLYVANVWNHAMATWNTNPSINQIKMKPKVVVKTLKQALTLTPHIIKAATYK